MNKRKQIGPHDLVVGGVYPRFDGTLVRQIDAIEGDTVHWRDEFGPGTCSAESFLELYPRIALADFIVAAPDEPDIAPTPYGHEGFTTRDEANALTAFAFRNGFIEELHAGRGSPLLEQPGYSRISDDEMRCLMIDASEKLAQMLRFKRSKPDEYRSWIWRYHAMYCHKWKKD